MDKTYIKVAGKYRNLYRAVNRNNFWNKNIKIRRCKYLNNSGEQDHRNFKGRITIYPGFKKFESAQMILAGIEVVSIIRKNQIVDSKKSNSKLTFH
jgi:putative transposase